MSRVVRRAVSGVLVFSMATLSLSQNLQAQSPQGQTKEHVVGNADLYAAMQTVSQARTTDRATVTEFFSSEHGARLLKFSGMDKTRVESAIAVLTDEELARLASQAKAVNGDFAAGAISPWTLVLIGGVTLAAIMLIVSIRDANSLD